MKKIVEIDDELYEKLEKIQKDYHIKTVSPVISLLLTLGVNWFEKLNSVSPTINIPTIIPFYIPEYTYPWGYTYGTTTTANYTGFTVGEWSIMSDMSGMSFDYVG